MPNVLPPLAALRAFEAAARLSSFTRAAEASGTGTLEARNSAAAATLCSGAAWRGTRAYPSPAIETTPAPTTKPKRAVIN